MKPRHFFWGAFGRIANSPSFQNRLKGMNPSNFSLEQKNFCLFAEVPNMGISLTQFPDNQGALFGKIFEKNSANEVVDLSLFIRKNPGDSPISYDSFWGKYVGAFFDKINQSLQLFRDPLGLSTLFYYKTDQGVIFSNQLSLLYDFLEAKLEYNWNYFAEKLLDRNHCLSITPFQGVKEILPGMEVSFDQNFQEQNLYFWDVERLACGYIENEKAFEEELLEVLKTTVKAWGAEHDAIAVELSGGTDSSGVLILLHHLFPGKEIFPIHYFDSQNMNSSELHFAESVAASCGYPLVRVDCAEKTWLDLKPAQWRSNRSRGCLYTSKRMEGLEVFMQTNHCSLLMNGQGGDHVFLSPPPSFAIRDLWNSKHLKGFFSVLRELSNIYRTPWWTLLRHEFKTKRVSQSEQLISPYFDPDWAQTFCEEEFFLHRKLSKLPFGKARQIKEIYHGVSYSERDELPFTFSHCHPLLSQPVVEKALQIPTYQSFTNGFDRVFFRRAVSRLHQTDTLWRRRKSNTNASSLKAFESNIEEIREMLLKGTLANSGVIHLPKVEKSLTQIRHGQLLEVWPILHLLECQKWFMQWDHNKLRGDDLSLRAHSLY